MLLNCPPSTAFTSGARSFSGTCGTIFVITYSAIAPDATDAYLHVRGNVHQAPNLLARDGVEEHGRRIAEDHVPVSRSREEIVRVAVEDDADERRGRHGEAAGRQLLSKRRKVPVADNRERGEESLFLLVHGRGDATDGSSVCPLPAILGEELLDRRLSTLGQPFAASRRRITNRRCGTATRDIVAAALEG